MRSLLKPRYILWPAVMLVAGLLLAGLWPRVPLHATATDATDTFALATGAVDADLEAVFWLDFLTGDLTAAVPGRSPGQFGAVYRYNVMADLNIQPTQNPRFLMVTGVTALRRGGGQIQPSLSAVYVAEITTGRMAAYAIPWDRTRWNAGQPIIGTLQLIAVMPMRGGGTATPAGPGAVGGLRPGM
jgi:hypothetical protein